MLWAGINSAFAAGAVLGSDIGWSELEIGGWRKHALSAFRGVLIAAPLVLIFGALFMAADAVYDGWVRATLNVDLSVVFSHGILFTVFVWLTAGYFRGALFAGTSTASAATLSVLKTDAAESRESKVDRFRSEKGEDPIVLPGGKTVVEHINTPDEPAPAEDPSESAAAGEQKRPEWSWANIDNSIVPGFTLGAVEVGVILGLVNLLFLSFVIFQVPYLFGGMELVQNTPDFKLADYARRGFGELVAVAALVLPMLLISHWLMKKESSSAQTLFRILAGVQIALLFVIMASAVQRLVLLTGDLGYGLTTVRLYPMIFMTWLAVVFVWFALTVLRGARQHFAWGALWAAFTILGATHVLNPDKFIVDTNVGLMHHGREFDASYNSTLSDDALPALMGTFDNLSEPDQQIVIRRIAGRFCDMRSETGLRSWNFSRWQASRLLNSDATLVKELEGCDIRSVRYSRHDDF